MDKIKVMQFILHFFILEKRVSPLTMETEDVIIDLHEDNRITLNCTYRSDDTELIPERNIRWQKQINGTFRDVAAFSPPNVRAPYITENMQEFYINRTELIGPNTSLSALMIIKNILCIDQGAYKCWIKYYVGISEKEKTSSSLVVFKTRATQPKEFLVFPHEVEENHPITIHCIADVGGPYGLIQIWKKTEKSSTYEVIYKSTTTNIKTENCTKLINVTTSYFVTRGDNGALFRCSSKNNFTKDLSSNSSTISVIYGPDQPKVTLTPFKSVYYDGEFLTIQCSSDSNPPPAFTWSFKPQNKSGDTRIEYSQDKFKLVFHSLKTENAGTYTCIVNNMTNNPNMTSFVFVHVKNSERKYTNCDQCGYIETCQQSDEKTVCAVNFWMPIAVVCILLSAAFAVSSTVLIMQRKRTQESIATNNIVFENRSPPSDATSEKVEIHGGYISPEDLVFGSPSTVTEKGNGAAYSRL